MTKTFKEVPKVETVDFCSLAAGDCFYFDNTYYMKLITKSINMMTMAVAIILLTSKTVF